MAVQVSVPHHYTEQLYVITTIFAVGAASGLASIGVRVADKSRRFILKRTERNEGVYIVPHSPLIASILIVVECALSISICFLARASWSYHSRLANSVLRTLTPLMPWPLWAWVWISLFSPIYAVHLFPVSTLEEATTRRVSKWVRFSPRQLNFGCYGIPCLVALPAISFSVAWSTEMTQGLATNDTGTVYIAARLYQVMWIVWLLVFVVTSLLYALYSIILIKILRHQLSTLKTVDKAIQQAKRNEDILAAQQSLRTSHVAQSNAATHHISIDPAATQDASHSGEKLKESASPSSERSRPTWFHRRASWLFQHSASRADGSSSLNATLKQYSKLDLLRLNTRLIVLEAVVFICCSALWCGLLLARIQVGLGLATSGLLVPTIVLIQLWIVSIFASTAAIIFWWRGISTNRVQREDGNGRALKFMLSPLNKLRTPRQDQAPKLEVNVNLPILEQDEDDLSSGDDEEKGKMFKSLDEQLSNLAKTESQAEPDKAGRGRRGSRAKFSRANSRHSAPDAYSRSRSSWESRSGHSITRSDWTAPVEWNQIDKDGLSISRQISAVSSKGATSPRSPAKQVFWQR